LVVFILPLSLVFSPSSSSLGSVFLFFVFCQFLPTRSSPLSFPLSSCSTFIYDLNSLSHVQEVFFAGFGLNFRWEEGGKERYTAAAGRLWEKEGSPSLSLFAFILHIN
jgi:hypothetical protein